MEQIEKDRRDAFLCKVYEFCNRIPNKITTGIWAAAQKWGLSDDEIERSANYFAGKGILEIQGASGTPVIAVKITSYGVDYIEDLDCVKLKQLLTT